MSENPYKTPESESTDAQTSSSTTFRQVTFVSWFVLVASSLLSLCFYRSPPMHGPDAVGREVTAFLLPCLIALFVSFLKNSKEVEGRRVAISSWHDTNRSG